MAGKGGGSWKVAYADFVTAMMAFFLVMWIGAQDVKVKQAVANYFVDPSGSSKKPTKQGAVMDKLTGGAVPDAEKTATGRGRNSYSTPGEGSWATKLVGEALHGDPKSATYWREQAVNAKQAAASDADVRSQKQTIEEVATKLITKQLRQELTQQIPMSATGVYQDLLYGSLLEVNWIELAEDLVRADKQ
jgi:chemotaxis protein MotB